MRQFLLTKLLCSECGEPLCLKYKEKGHTPYVEGEPTGADKVELTVCVLPCAYCASKTQKILDALRTLNEIK